MLEHGIEWEQKGSHEEHLSVLDYKKQERSKEVTALEGKLETVQSKVVKIIAVEKIAAKPAFFDGSKVVIAKEDFEDVKTLAQKQIVANYKETGLITENKALRSENKILCKENFNLKQEVSEQKGQLFENRLTISKLESKIKQLQRIVERIMQFIAKQGLKQQLDKFLKPHQKKRTVD